MSFIDERGRLWGRINVIDLLILVLLVTGAVGVGYTRFSDRLAPTFTGDQAILQVEFQVAGVRQATIDALEMGATFYNTQTNDRIGTLVGVRAEPAELITILPNGEVMEGLSSTRYDVYLTLEGTGRVTTSVILLGNQEIRIGTRVPLKSRLASVTGTVMAIDTGPR